MPGVEQVLILGAGFDSRAYRLAQLRDVAVFEADHPATQAAKRRMLRRGLGQIPASVGFVPVEFGADDPAAKLAEGGFGPGKPTLVLWEGVTNYLDPVSVDSTFALPRAGEPFTFGLDPQQVPGYLSERGFELRSDIVVREAAERFYPAGACPSAPAYYHGVESRRV
jgi:Leucine carboxyl methyltransferase